MIAGLERCMHRPTAILAALVALTAAALVLFPSVARAQEEEEQGEAKAPATPLAQSVVSPGDTLWSISQERLGPGAPPERVALEVQRIHELNRDQIGDDPSLILPGQRLSLPPSAEEPTAEKNVGHPVAETPAAPPSKPPEGAAVAMPEAPERAAQLSDDLATEPVAPPALPEVQAVPRVRSLPAASGSEGAYEDAAERRRMLGFGVLTLTLVLGALMAWKLPMRRAVGDAVWGAPLEYRRYYHGYLSRPERDEDAASSPGSPARPEGARRPSVPTKAALFVAAGATQRRKKRAGAVRRSPSRGLAVTYSPVLVRALRRSSSKKARAGGLLSPRRARGRRYGFIRGGQGRAR